MDCKRGCEGMRHTVRKKKRKRRKEKAVVIWDKKNSSDSRFTVYVLVFSIYCLIFSIWTFLSNWHDVKGAYLIDRDQLSATQGEILSSTTYTSKARKRKTYYHYSIKYQFAYNGRVYRSDEVTFNDNYSQSPDFAQAYIERYQQGKDVTVYFDPKDPSFSVLEPENINDFNEAWFVLFLSLIGFAIYGCILLKQELFGYGAS
jgi:Protein of unknown function (DUF3592)